ncbi:MAG: hypothetical protein Q8P18_33215 [Pseudomonadota bacterium]|nr:hypothetical protein [Pseudomonadota bacterium]
MSQFIPSEQSYSGWYDDAKAAATAKYDAAVAAVEAAKYAALAPARAASAAADRVEAAVQSARDTAAATQAAAEAARDTAATASSWVPWIAGGGVVLGAIYLASRSGRIRNPSPFQEIPKDDSWIKLGLSSFTDSYSSSAQSVQELRAARDAREAASAYGRGAVRGVGIGTGIAYIPRILNLLGVPV